MKKIILTFLALALAASTASAMDSKMYLKGNAGAGFSKAKASGKVNANLIAAQSNYAISKAGKGFVGSVAIGSVLGSNVRTDLEVFFDGGNKSKYSAANATTQKGSMKTSSITGLVNAHYDFKNTTNLTPFITIGAGYGSSKYKVSVAQLNANPARQFNKSSAGVAFQAGVGVAYSVAHKVNLELGYRYISKGGKTKTITIDTNNTIRANKSSTTSNVIMAGLRIGL